MTQQKSAGSAFLAQFLRDSHAVCPVCRYSLRDCQSDKCPECGAALMLGVLAQSPSRPWWFAAVFGSALATFICLLLLTSELWNHVGPILHDPSILTQVKSGNVSVSELPYWPTVYLFGAASAAGLAMLGWLIGTRRQPALSAIRQRWLELMCIMSPLILLVLMGVLHR